RDMHAAMVGNLARLGLLTERVRPRLEKLGVTLPTSSPAPRAPPGAGRGGPTAPRAGAGRQARARRARAVPAVAGRSPGPPPTCRRALRGTGGGAPSARTGPAPARPRSGRVDRTRG